MGKLEFETVLSAGQNIRLHHTGYIIIDLSSQHRLHVWPRPQDVPPVPSGHSGIHDYRFGFDVFVVHGRLTHMGYRIEPSIGGTFLILDSIDDSPYNLLDERLYTVVLCEGTTYLPEDTYQVEPSELHGNHVDAGTICLIRYFPSRTNRDRMIWNINHPRLEPTQQSNEIDGQLWDLVEQIFNAHAV